LFNCYVYIAYTLDSAAASPSPSYVLFTRDSLFIIIKSGQRPINTNTQWVKEGPGGLYSYISSVATHRWISPLFSLLASVLVRQLFECVFCGVSPFVTQSFSHLVSPTSSKWPRGKTSWNARELKIQHIVIHSVVWSSSIAREESRVYLSRTQKDLAEFQRCNIICNVIYL